MSGFGKGPPLTDEQRAVHEIRADETLALRARIAELEAALKPFAYDYGDYSDGMWSDLDYIQVSVGDLRAARAALEGK
jgi:hypothetical protein